SPLPSADMSSPRPDPRPAGSPKKSSNHREANRNCNEPGHDPPRQGLRRERCLPTGGPLPNGVRKNEDRCDDGRRHDDGPCVKKCEEPQQKSGGDENTAQIPGWAARPERLPSNVDVEIRNYDERNDDERGNQNAGDKRREEVQQLL